jgi:predicted exporter
MESTDNAGRIIETDFIGAQPTEAAVMESKNNTWDVLAELPLVADIPAVPAEKKSPTASAQRVKRLSGTVMRKLILFLTGFHSWVSLFMVMMGVLIIASGCVFAFMISFNEMVSLTVAFVSVVTGTFFIGISKLIEAAEIYVIKNSVINSHQNKPLSDSAD